LTHPPYPSQYPQGEPPRYPYQPPPPAYAAQPSYAAYQQPGYDNQPPPAYGAGYYPGAPVPAPRRPSLFSRLLWRGVPVLGTALLIGAGIAIRAASDDGPSDARIDAETPDVGECVKDGVLPQDRDVVPCDSEQADWRVIGDAGTWTERDYDATPVEELCQDFPGSEFVMWVGGDSEDGSAEGNVVCMEPVGQE
jgi:hypothetical protein